MLNNAQSPEVFNSNALSNTENTLNLDNHASSSSVVSVLSNAQPISFRQSVIGAYHSMVSTIVKAYLALESKVSVIADSWFGLSENEPIQREIDPKVAAFRAELNDPNSPYRPRTKEQSEEMARKIQELGDRTMDRLIRNALRGIAEEASSYDRHMAWRQRNINAQRSRLAAESSLVRAHNELSERVSSLSMRVNNSMLNVY